MIKLKKIKLTDNIWYHELQCKCCGVTYDKPAIVAYELQQIVNAVKEEYNIDRISVKVTSACRCYNYLQTQLRVPYTQDGTTALVQNMQNSLEQGVNNGLIVRNGFLDDGTYLAQGYEVTAVPVEKVDLADKARRIYKGLEAVCILQGAIHTVEARIFVER